MDIYIVVLALMAISTYLFCNKSTVKIYISSTTIDMFAVERVTLVLFFVVLTIIAGTREFSVGTDTPLYVVRFIQIGQSSWSNLKTLSNSYLFEIGFTVYCKLLYSVFADYRFFLLVTALWTSFMFYLLIKRYSKFQMLSLFVLYTWGIWGVSMNIMRQMMVVPFLYLAIDYGKQRKFFKFAVIILFASLFHSSSLVFFAVYPIINVRLKLKIIVIALAFAAFFGFVGFEIIGRLLSGFAVGRYFQKNPSDSGLSTFLLIVLVLFIVCYLRNELVEIDDNINVWALFLIIAMCSTAIGMRVGIFERITKIFITSFIFVFPDLYLYGKKQNLGIIALPLLSILLVYYYFYVVMSSPSASGGIYPYFSWL